MLMPSIFGEDLFEDLFDLPFYDDSKVEKKLYGRHAKNLMKTDIKEIDNGGYDRGRYQGRVQTWYLKTVCSKEGSKTGSART